MKDHISFHLAPLAAIALSTTICTGQSNVVFYGTDSTNMLNVTFEDTGLSVYEKSAITADLRICLRNWGKEGEVRLQDNEGFAGYLYIGTTCPHYPEEMNFPNNIVDSPNGLALQVPKALSDAYTNAFVFVAANAKKVKAAYEFASFIASTNFNNITPNQLSHYIHYNKLPQKGYIVGFSEIMSDLREQAYYLPSVLSFHYSAEGPDKKNLWMYLPASSPLSYHDSLGWNPFPVLWHDGKWKICLWEDDPDIDPE